LRRLRRFFSSQPIIQKGQFITLSLEETHHLKRIIRLAEGDSCLVTDGLGKEAQAKILKFEAHGSCSLVIETVTQTVSPEEQNRVRIKVLQALAHKGVLEALIEKSQEIGVEEFWPIQTKNSTLKIRKEDEARVLARWQKKVKEAAKQSGAFKLTLVQPVQTLKEAVGRISPNEKIIIFHPCGDAVPFRRWLEEVDKEAASGRQVICNLCFGPEGGFDAREIEFLRNQSESKGISCKIVSLGGSILRIDTAFLGVVLALKLYLCQIKLDLSH